MKEYAVNDIVTGFKWVGTRPIRPDGVPKVTGRAMYAADYTMAGAIIGKILRSPHAHARIRSINTSKAEKLPGVKAVITAKDFPEQKFEYIGPERVAVNFWNVTRNIMAREKTLYEGHAIAAVAAIDAATADEALSLIEVDYEVLPHVIDVDEAMAEDAPLLFEDMITRGVEPTPTKPSNISKRLEFKIGDLDSGWAQAAVIVEEEFKTAAVHQGYIEPHACCVRVDPDGQTEIWSSSQGHFVVRALTAKLLNKPVGDVRCSPAEIGRLSRAGFADLGVRGRERHGHAGEEDRHGSGRIAAQERRRSGHADDLRAKARPWRLYRDPRSRHEPSRLQDAARSQSGPWRRVRLLVQWRRRVERNRADQRRRHDPRRDRQPRYRRLARVDGADGGRDVRCRLQPGAGDRRRHRLGRLHACDRRLARHLRDRHGGRRCL